MHVRKQIYNGSHKQRKVFSMETWLLIAIAVLQIVDGRGLALRIGRLLALLMGGQSNVKETGQN